MKLIKVEIGDVVLFKDRPCESTLNGDALYIVRAIRGDFYNLGDNTWYPFEELKLVAKGLDNL